MENIGGIFVVLICGLIIAVFVAIMEFVWSTRRTAETDEVHHRTHTHTHTHTYRLHWADVSTAEHLYTDTNVLHKVKFIYAAHFQSVLRKELNNVKYH